MTSPKVIAALVAAFASALPVPSLFATPLDPTAFTSLGTPLFTGTSYTVETSFNNAQPTIVDNASSMVIATGVFSGSGLNSVAVFDFSTLVIPVGVTLTGATDANSRPFALLSQGSFILAGTVIASGASAIAQGGANAGPGGGGGGGAANGGGGAGLTPGGSGGAGGSPGGGGGARGSNFFGASGGGFGGVGGSAGTTAGGASYGGLLTALQGGSGGGGAAYGAGELGGGGGGGAVEFGAVQTLTLTGTVSADGGSGNSAGGSGGGILLHASTVTISGTSVQISARGGNGSLGAGGGGGRIAIATASGALDPLSTNGSGYYNVSGGTAGAYGTAGAAGPAPEFATATAAPEPGGFALAAMGIGVLGVVQRWRRKNRCGTVLG